MRFLYCSVDRELQLVSRCSDGDETHYSTVGLVTRDPKKGRVIRSVGMRIETHDS
jgi:hypothetical protein